MIHIGDNKLKSCYFGDEVIGKVYRGDDLLFVKASRLPEGYTEVEYIQSSGTQYISTGVVPGVSNGRFDTKISMDVQPLSPTYSPAKYFFGSYYDVTSNTKSYRFTAHKYTSNNYGTMINSASVSSKVIAQDNTTARRIVVVDGPNAIASTLGGEADFSNNTITVINGVVMDLLGAYGYTNSYSHIGMIDAKLFSCQIEKAGSPVRDFVPCISPTGAVGLYDLVGGKFYANAGTGAFTAGPAV